MTEISTVPERAVQHPDQLDSAARASIWQTFATAVQFLTRVPLSTHNPPSAAALSKCPIFFPIVGGLIGVVTCVVLGTLCLFWPVWLAVLLALAIEARLTGAFHEDAVADFCDAFGGGWTRDDVLRILNDSRIGSFGALGLGLAMATRGGAMMEIIHQSGRSKWLAWSSALIASSAIGRWVIVVVMVRVPPVISRESLSRDIGRQLNTRDLLYATLGMLPFTLPFIIQWPLHAVLSSALLIPFVFWFVILVRRRLGGMTGDCLGCVCYASMIIVLLATAARWQS